MVVAAGWWMGHSSGIRFRCPPRGIPWLIQQRYKNPTRLDWIFSLHFPNSTIDYSIDPIWLAKYPESWHATKLLCGLWSVDAKQALLSAITGYTANYPPYAVGLQPRVPVAVPPGAGASTNFSLLFTNFITSGQHSGRFKLQQHNMFKFWMKSKNWNTRIKN